MKKFMIVFIMLVMALVFTVPSQAALRHFELSVYKATSADQLSDIQKATRLTTGVEYIVYAYSSTTAKSVTRETVYSDRGVTSITMDPVVTSTVFATTGRIDFWADPTETGDAKVDIIAIDMTNGYSTRKVVDYNIDHAIVIDEIPGIYHMLTFPFWSDKDTAIDTAVDTGIDLRPSTVLVDAFIDVHTVTATAGTLDVGTRDSNAAYISGSSTAALGFVQDDVFDTAMQFLTQAAGIDDRSLSYVQHGPGSGALCADGLISILFIER